MKGVQFVTDDAGKRTAVLISLAEWGELWEDIYDIMVSESRKREATVPWEELKFAGNQVFRQGCATCAICT
jgi:hypothetical protein